jgi:Acetyltransferase (GNAT) family
MNPDGQQPEPLRALPAESLTAWQRDQVRELYHQGFPPHLRVPFAELAGPGPSGLLLAGLAGEDPVAFAAMMTLRQARWTFLRYYAVASARRREGLGRRFWRVLLPALAEAHWPGRVVFEVEDPRDAADDETEHRIRTGRIAFWQDCGARLLPVDGYVMPDLTGLAAPERMQLMAYDPARPADLTAEGLADLVTGLYAERYGLGAADPLVTAALASVSAPSFPQPGPAGGGPHHDRGDFWGWQTQTQSSPRWHAGRTTGR